MITAKDVYELLKVKNTCKGIYAWIKHGLSNWFNSDMIAVIGEDRVTIGQLWDKTMFISNMKERGFDVEYFCEDRPCGNCYFKISIPPQER